MLLLLFEVSLCVFVWACLSAVERKELLSAKSAYDVLRERHQLILAERLLAGMCDAVVQLDTELNTSEASPRPECSVFHTIQSASCQICSAMMTKTG